jgi:hypothetical protein
MPGIITNNYHAVERSVPDKALMKAQLEQFETYKESAINSTKTLDKRAAACDFNECYDNCNQCIITNPEIGCDWVALGCFSGCCIACGC